MADNKDSNQQDHYNHSGMVAFLFSMAFVFAFFIYIVAVHPGVDLQENIKEPPVATVEEKAVDVSKVTEPWIENPDMIKHGAKLYAQNCAMCHGAEGKGDGAAGQALNPKPRNLVEGPWKKGGGYIGMFTVLTEGLAGTSMASYGHLSALDRWAMTQFVNSITKVRPNEDPAKIAEFAKSAK
jgi:cytochrome c